jgi:glycosyltransferase involved in cell wall biosynthesis
MSDEVITVSQFLVEKLLSIGLKPNKLHMIPNGFDNQLFKPTSREAARHKLGLPVNKRLLLSVGNLNNLKGHTYLIEAMRKVRHSIDDVLLIIIGSGPLEFELQKQIIASDLKKNVILVGNKRHEEIPLWMNACDLFVHPSLHESFGVVVIEALACGKPVLSTTVGGLPEIIRSGDLGLLVQSSNAQSLANGILDCLSKNWVEEKIINFSQQYTWRNLTSRIVGVYEKAIE